MQVEAVKTRLITSEDSLESILNLLPELAEEDIVVITSKVISVIQNRWVLKSMIDKHQLILEEADAVLDMQSRKDFYLTFKGGILIPNAGIDESNSQDYYILYPKKVQTICADSWEYLKVKNNIKKLGVVITDSHTTIMRRGVTGIALSWCGFAPIYSYIGAADLFGRELLVSQVNILDSLATPAVFVMGEGAESTPITIIKDVPRIVFSNSAPTQQELKSIIISLEEDLYGPLLKAGAWNSLKLKDGNWVDSL